MFVHDELMPIKPVESIASPEPHEATVILQDRPNRWVRQAVLNRKVLELNIFSLSVEDACKLETNSNGESNRG